MRASRREFLAGGLATGLAGGLAAAGVGRAGAATGARPRTGLLAPGSRPFPQLPAGTDQIPQIEHIVVLMMENHSFDDHLGMLGRGDGFTLGSDRLPLNYNPDPSGGYLRSFPMPSTCQPTNEGVSQSWNASHLSYARGANTGFVASSGPDSMGYWGRDQLPFYYDMASRFPVGDRYFASVLAQTYPNRRFLIAGTALGDVATNSSGVSATLPPNGTIFQQLDLAGISWKNYYPVVPTVALFYPLFTANDGTDRLASMARFLADAASGQLPAFSLVDPWPDDSEEHGDISIGEAYTAAVVNALMAGPKWSSTALIWIYDEHGGYYDHVPPPAAVAPDDVPPEITVPPDQPGGYDRYGFRVPCCVVSAWSRADYVSHQVYDHTSVLKLVETKWNLPALTYRDANAGNMLDFFDFSSSTPPSSSPPPWPPPSTPTTP